MAALPAVLLSWQQRLLPVKLGFAQTPCPRGAVHAAHHQGQSRPAAAVLRPLLVLLSQPRTLQASPEGTPAQRRTPALGHPPPAVGLAADDLVLRRLPGRTLRDRPRFLRRHPAEAQTSRPDRQGFPDRPGAPAAGLLPRPGRWRPHVADSAVGRLLVGRWLHPVRLRRFASGVPTRRRVGTTPG